MRRRALLRVGPFSGTPVVAAGNTPGERGEVRLPCRDGEAVLKRRPGCGFVVPFMTGQGGNTSRLNGGQAMWWIIGGLVVFFYLFIFSAVRVAAKADRDLEEWLAEKRREG